MLQLHSVVNIGEKSLHKIVDNVQCAMCCWHMQLVLKTLEKLLKVVIDGIFQDLIICVIVLDSFQFYLFLGVNETE